MLNIITKREASDEEGFTLIELIVVVAVLGILTAIAIPTYGHIRSLTQIQALHATNDTEIKNMRVAVGMDPTTADEAADRTIKHIFGNIYEGEVYTAVQAFPLSTAKLYDPEINYSPICAHSTAMIGDTVVVRFDGDVEFCRIIWTSGDEGLLHIP